MNYHRTPVLSQKLQTQHCGFIPAFISTSNSVFYSPVMTVTAPAEEFNKGATIRLLSDTLSFSLHCGSAESSPQPLMLLSSFYPSLCPQLFHPPLIFFLFIAMKGFLFNFFLLLFFLAHFSSNIFICNVKIMTGILRSHAWCMLHQKFCSLNFSLLIAIIQTPNNSLDRNPSYCLESGLRWSKKFTKTDHIYILQSNMILPAWDNIMNSEILICFVWENIAMTVGVKSAFVY